jgi:hypothetical protein
MSALMADKGESSRSTGPSDQSREVHLRQHRHPAAGPGSSFRTADGSQEATAPEEPHPFSGFVNQPSSLPFANATEAVRAGGGGSAFSDTQAADGSAVVELLSRWDDSDTLPLEADLDQDVSTDTVQSLRAALFSTSDHTCPVQWDSLLNLTPDYVLNPTEASSSAELHFGTSDGHAVREGWYQQWEHVLSAYTDQVWGDLLPLAVEARREVDELSQQPPEAEAHVPKALNRLRMILAHIQRSGGQ